MYIFSCFVRSIERQFNASFMHHKETSVPSGLFKNTTEICDTFMVQSGWVCPGRNICHLLQRWPIWSKAEMTNATKALETTNTPL